MSDYKFDTQATIALLERAVQNMGEDFVYPDEWKADTGTSTPACAYVRNGAPSCIVGQVFSYVLTPEQFEQVGVEERQHNYALGASEMAVKIDPLLFSPEARGILQDVQFDQDTGVKWGNAVERMKQGWGYY